MPLKALIAKRITSGVATPKRLALWIALAWAIVTFTVLALTAPAQGIGRDESIYLIAGESYAAFWGELFTAPSHALDVIDQRFEINHEHPPLSKELYGATHALVSDALGWGNHLQGSRVGAFLFAALLSSLLALAGFELAGLGGALLAPALYWAVPRHFYHGHPAALDLPITVLWFATVLAYRRVLRSRARFPIGASIALGLVYGAALAAKHNSWFLPPLLVLHAAALMLPQLRPAGARPPWRSVLLAFAAMAIIGPLVFLASWPWLWHDTGRRLHDYVFFHLNHEHYSWLYLGELMRRPPFPMSYPFVVTALTVPAAIAFLYAAGFVHSVARFASGVLHGLRRPASRREGDAPSAPDEFLFALNAFFPIALIALPTVPHFGGVKHWMTAMPFLALLGARALVTAGRVLCPARPLHARWVTAGLAALAILPGAWAVAHVHPYGTAAYNELAGGAPGAATLGMQRQFWGDNVVGLLDQINEHARPGARIWWQETSGLAVHAWQRDDLVRRDLGWLDGPEGADIAIWQFHQEFRDKEFQGWSAFAEVPQTREPLRLPRPVTGLYLDEVPLVEIYARPGAWR